MKNNKKRIITIIIIGIFLLIGGWLIKERLSANGFKTLIKKDEISNNLQLIIKSDKEIYKIAEPIKIEIQLKNISREELVVNIGVLDYLTLFLKFKIVDTKKNIEVEQIPIEYEPPQFDKNEDFIVLKPGLSVKKTVDILEIWDNQKEGAYYITAIYDIPAWCNEIVYEQEPEFRKVNINAWTGTLLSNAIMIKLEQRHEL